MVLLIVSEKWMALVHTGRRGEVLERLTGGLGGRGGGGKAGFYIKPLLLEYVH